MYINLKRAEIKMSETRNQSLIVISLTLFFSILLVSASWVYCDTYDDDKLLEFYWTPATGNVVHYNVYLSINVADYTLVGTTPNAPTLENPYPVPVTAQYGYNYRLKVEAEDAMGNVVASEPSDIVICKLRSPGDIFGITKGDADGNLRVGARDLAILCASWKKEGGVDPSFDYRADLNYDNFVNVSDWNVISDNLGNIYSGAISKQIQQNPVVSSGNSFKVRLTAQQNLKVGEETTIEIVAEGAEDLYAMDFEVSFNPDVIKIEDIQKGTFFSVIESNPSDKTLKAELASNPSWIAGKINKSPGRISPTLIAVPLGDVNGRSGDGVIATIKILAKSGGVSTISLKNINAYDSKLNSIMVNNFDSMLKIEAVKNILEQNYPNPFNPETWIPYAIEKECDNVSITIYNSLGQEVRRLELGQRSAGFYTSKDRAVYWDGKNNDGTLVASGVYFYQIKAGNFSSIKKMVVLK
jgi:hypothetical protein